MTIETDFCKKVFLVQNRKNKRHHRIHYIQIRLATKFQLIQEILLFGPILTKKDTPALKKKKRILLLNSAYPN